jgi:RNA polymerase nonessential primary-like sigma factor
MTLAKIGDRLSISRERVRQIEREALTKLRKRQSDIREYLAS